MAGMVNPTINLLDAQVQKSVETAVRILPVSNVNKQIKNDFFLPIRSFK